MFTFSLDFSERFICCLLLVIFQIYSVHPQAQQSKKGACLLCDDDSSVSNFFKLLLEEFHCRCIQRKIMLFSNNKKVEKEGNMMLLVSGGNLPY